MQDALGNLTLSFKELFELLTIIYAQSSETYEEVIKIYNIYVNKD